jgi:hypothetical protein
MNANQAEYSVQMMSRTLGVSRSGFYAYHSRPPSVRQGADEALTKRIAAIQEASKRPLERRAFTPSRPMKAALSVASVSSV